MKESTAWAQQLNSKALRVMWAVTWKIKIHSLRTQLRWKVFLKLLFSLLALPQTQRRLFANWNKSYTQNVSYTHPFFFSWAGLLIACVLFGLWYGQIVPDDQHSFLIKLKLNLCCEQKLTFLYLLHHFRNFYSECSF